MGAAGPVVTPDVRDLHFISARKFECRADGLNMRAWRIYTGGMPKPISILAALICFSCFSCSNQQDSYTVPEIPPGERHSFVQKQLGSARSLAVQYPDNAGALGGFALVLHKYGMHQQAESLYAQARKLAPEEFRWAYMHGYVLEALGNDERAREAFETAARIDPKAGTTYLGVVLLKLGETEAARETLLEALAHDELNARALYELGRLESAGGDLDLAEKYLSRGLASGATHPSIYYALAEVKKRQGNEAETAKYLQRFNETSIKGTSWPDPSLASLGISDKNLMDAAVQALQRGDIKRAIELNKQARELNPDNPLPPAALVGLYAITGDNEKSDEALAIARYLDPDSAQFHYNVGLARMAQKRFAEAIEAMLKVTEIDPQGSLAWVKLGDIYAAQGNREEAIEAFAHALERTPADEELRLKLGVLYIQMQRFEEGLATLEAPASSDRLEARRLWAVGRAHRYLGNIKQATVALEGARAIALRVGDERLANTVGKELQQFDAARAYQN